MFFTQQTFASLKSNSVDLTVLAGRRMSESWDNLVSLSHSFYFLKEGGVWGIE